MVKTFLDGKKPIVSMIQCRTEKECIQKIEASLSAGADAFGVQLCQLEREERTDKKLKNIIRACTDKPVYITSYRYNRSEGMSDEECADLLLRALNCGATLLDIPGDLFDKNEYQITDSQAAVDQQKELVGKIRAQGGEVLMSTHDFRPLSADAIYAVAEKQAERGADIIKIVVKSESMEMLPSYIGVIQKVKNELKKPFLFLDIGACSEVLRYMGPSLGTCMYLCVESHGALDTPAQPLIKNIRSIKKIMEVEQNESDPCQ